MAHTLRIGIQILPDDPFWVQVHEVLWQRARALPIELVEVAIRGSHMFSTDERIESVEDLDVQELDALISNSYPVELLTAILDQGLPIVYVAEIDLRHPRLTSRTGLYDAARTLGTFLAERLPTGGTLLIVGGLVEGEDNGQSRLDGFMAALPADGRFVVHHVPSSWTDQGAQECVTDWLSRQPDIHIDAIFGLSDSLALTARAACAAQGRLGAATLTLGINGDPIALAAIAEGRMAATVETDVEDIATQAIELAYRAARGEPLPPQFRHMQRLVTAENVAEVAMRKLISLATLPMRLAEANRHSEQQRVTQLEISAAIDRQIGNILDEQQLSLAITALIRDSYGFDEAQLLIWEPETARLVAVGASQPTSEGSARRPDPAGPLAYVLDNNQTVFIPDTLASHRFAPDPLAPGTRSRVVVPVRRRGQVVGLLDLHRRQPAHHTREELAGLQLLADQLAIAMRNAELYGQELAARALAEKADRLKTALLANVSHELRTPLNVILGYSRAVLDALAGGAAPGPELAGDLIQIARSGEHLLRLINDLLDLSRAEIGELDLLPERIDTHSFLEEVFRSSAHSFGAGGAVAWRLELPPQLPAMKADPVRLRQILLNLLHNASKFTERGSITLGAEVTPSELHLWVADSGRGIPEELRSRIFEPFVSADSGARRHEGIGLGLSITRRLVLLHRGRITLESRSGGGSTFHIYLPLPRSDEAVASPGRPYRRALLAITTAASPPASLVALAERRGLALHALDPHAGLAEALGLGWPALLALDLASAAVDGWDAVEQIRAQPRLSQLPVLLYHGADTIHEAAGAATGLLLKPLGDEVLLDALRDLDPQAPHGSVLIVEDDPQLRALHRSLIAAHFPGYRIHDVGDGQSALEAIAHETPSLILLDLLMPGVDGFAVLAALRADLRTSMVPVLVLSGKALTADDIRRLAEARVIFQTKETLSEDELAEALRRTMDRADLLPPQTSALVKAAIGFIQQHYNETLTRHTIAERVGVSKDYLGRIFQQELGLSPWDYLIRYRMVRARDLLLTTSYSIAEVATRVGFDTAAYFSTAFHREVGCSPREYRAAGRDFKTAQRDS